MGIGGGLASVCPLEQQESRAMAEGRSHSLGSSLSVLLHSFEKSSFLLLHKEAETIVSVCSAFCGTVIPHPLHVVL